MATFNIDAWSMAPDKKHFFMNNIYTEYDVMALLANKDIPKIMNTEDWADLAEFIILSLHTFERPLAMTLVEWIHNRPNDLNDMIATKPFTRISASQVRRTVNNLISYALTNSKTETVLWAMSESMKFIENMPMFISDMFVGLGTDKDTMLKIFEKWLKDNAWLVSSKAFEEFITDKPLLKKLSEYNFESPIIFKVTKDIRFAPKAIQKMFLHKDEK